MGKGQILICPNLSYLLFPYNVLSIVGPGERDDMTEGARHEGLPIEYLWLRWHVALVLLETREEMRNAERRE